MVTVYEADSPVTFLQIPEGVIEPATKLTVEHYRIRHQSAGDKADEETD